MSRPSFVLFAQNYLSALLSNFGTVFLNEPIPRNPKLRVYKHPSRSGWEGDYLKAVLGDSAHISISPEIIGEAELVDVLFEPDPTKSRATLGVLDTLTSVPCIIHTFHSPPEADDILDLIRNWLCWYAEDNGSIVPLDVSSRLEDDDRERPDPIDSNKAQIIIFPTVKIFKQYKLLRGFGGKRSPKKIPGVYCLPPGLFNITLVFTHLLPVDASTLWLRLLGRGEIQRQAIIELVNSDTDDLLYTLARQQLREWYQVLLQDQRGQESPDLMQALALVDGSNQPGFS